MLHRLFLRWRAAFTMLKWRMQGRYREVEQVSEDWSDY